VNEGIRMNQLHGTRSGNCQATLATASLGGH
jgi:hypothetical protein